jgi:hypothetical protein
VHAPQDDGMASKRDEKPQLLPVKMQTLTLNSNSHICRNEMWKKVHPAAKMLLLR